jgi:hypothetical protein
MVVTWRSDPIELAMALGLLGPAFAEEEEMDDMKNAEQEFIRAGIKAREMKKNRGRNWLAVNAHHRKAGAMKDRKKAANKKACRGQVKGGE